MQSTGPQERTVSTNTLLLDVQLSSNERKAIERLLKEGKTVFKVSKDAQLAVRICSAVLFAVLFAGSALVLLAQTTTLVTAKFSYNDGTAVTGSVQLFRVASPEISLGKFQLDTQGRLSTSIALDSTAQYHAQLLAPDGTVILDALSIPLPAAINANVIAALPTGEIDFVISKTVPSAGSTQVTFIPFPPPPPPSPTGPTTLVFSNPPPSTNPIKGIYKFLDWGVDQWALDTPWGGCPDDNIYFSSTGTSRNFSFTSPRVLTGAQVCTPTPGTLTLTSDAGETFSQAIISWTYTNLKTGWTKPATQITVSFTGGWNLGVDTISYQ